jgi:tripartite-type tricarboxylate transporter receptor subunit TctC
VEEGRDRSAHYTAVTAMNPISRWILVGVLSGVVSLASAASPVRGGTVAGEYPNRPIRLLLPFPPGAATDAVVRIMVPRLSEVVGQQWVVDNRSGAGGNIAGDLVAKAAPDGYTLLLGFSTFMTVNSSLYANMPFDPLKDLAPITQTATSQYKLMMHSSVPAKTVKELVAYAKANPGKLNYASAGVASPLHLAAELFKSRAGVDIVHVPFKGGGPAAAALLSGEAQLSFSNVSSSLDHIRSGRLRAVAVTGLTRSALAPELPTLHESGYPGYSVTSWHSLLTTAGTPQPIIRRLHDAAVQVIRIPEVAKLINNAGYEPTGTSPQELLDLMRTETKTWAKLVKDANIRPD